MFHLRIPSRAEGRDETADGIEHGIEIEQRERGEGGEVGAEGDKRMPDSCGGFCESYTRESGDELQ